MAIDGKEVHYLSYPGQGGSTADRQARYEAEQQAVLAYHNDHYLRELVMAIIDATQYLIPCFSVSTEPGVKPTHGFKPEMDVRTINKAFDYHAAQCRERHPLLEFQEPTYLPVFPPGLTHLAPNYDFLKKPELDS